MTIELEYVHHLILIDAADEANRSLSEEASNDTPFGRDIGIPPGEAYRADPIASKKGGLCLSIEPSVTQGRSPETLQKLKEIGIKAIHKSLVENNDKFIGLILGEAREGRNYFDRFDLSDQLRFF